MERKRKESGEKKEEEKKGAGKGERGVSREKRGKSKAETDD